MSNLLTICLGNQCNIQQTKIKLFKWFNIPILIKRQPHWKVSKIQTQWWTILANPHKGKNIILFKPHQHSLFPFNSFPPLYLLNDYCFHNYFLYCSLFHFCFLQTIIFSPSMYRVDTNLLAGNTTLRPRPPPYKQSTLNRNGAQIWQPQQSPSQPRILFC